MSNATPHETSESKYDLQFLTVTDLAEFRDPQTKRKVRSHIQRGRQRHLRHGEHSRKDEIVLDTSSLSAAHEKRSHLADQLIQIAPQLPHPSDLGAGRSDPFKRYPIDMNLRTHELFDHLQGNDCSMFRTLNKIGFFQLVQHETAFRQILYTSSADMARLRNYKEENIEVISLSGKAIRSLSRLIADPMLCTGDEIIISVLAFACHCVMSNDGQGVLTHFQGLEEIIKRKGGLPGLGDNQVLRTMFFWLDVNAAFLLDRPLRFPIPSDMLPPVNADLPSSFATSPVTKLSGTADFLSATADLFTLNQLIINEMALRDLWDDGVFAGLLVVPVIAKFLSIPHNITEQDPGVANQEAFRLGALLYLSVVRRRFGVDLGVDIYLSKLKVILAIPDQDLDCLVSIWLLVLGGLQSFLSEHHQWYISATADLVFKMQYSFWTEVKTALEQVLWIEGLLEEECEKFRMEVTSNLWENFEYWLH
ncbi:hypothetical protein BKA64DRAFT_177854 [Cadophora sp. MPI-SDFR-AT-0126]|nr:hypothetical protein BKA64DRAFT_177854 [Leotiomycetes sp. MPI-SDFR-AT-0126]